MSLRSGQPAEPIDEHDLRELRVLLNNMEDMLDQADEALARARYNLVILQQKCEVLGFIFDSRH